MYCKRISQVWWPSLGVLCWGVRNVVDESSLNEHEWTLRCFSLRSHSIGYKKLFSLETLADEVFIFFCEAHPLPCDSSHVKCTLLLHWLAIAGTLLPLWPRFGSLHAFYLPDQEIRWCHCKCVELIFLLCKYPRSIFFGQWCKGRNHYLFSCQQLHLASKKYYIVFF